MSQIVGVVLAFIKWPVALVIALLTPAAAWTLWDLAQEAHAANFWRSPFVLGFGVMLVGMTVCHRARFVQFWATLEHEFTHALFAWLTLVRVTELWTSDGSSTTEGRRAVGLVRLDGSNWLISISPYFFPTAAVVLISATWVLAEVPTSTASLLTGCATGWCVVSTWHETHSGQSDLQNAGWIFSALFLPGANILSYGLILAHEVGGPERALDYAVSVIGISFRWLLGEF
jgi:hypothetical protein